MKHNLFFVIFFCSLFSMAQRYQKVDNYEKWSFKVGLNAVNNSGDSNVFKVFETDKMAFSNPIAAGLDYKISPHWSVGFFISNNKFLKSKAVIDGEVITKNLGYLATDVNAKYYLWSAQREEKNNFTMYFSGGFGAFNLSGASLSYNFGGGLTYWINSSLGVNFETMAKWSGEDDVLYNTGHIQYFAGIAFRPKVKADRDQDGVIDSEDFCPDVFGFAEFKGCPDRDNDGVEDAKDNCPKIAGTKANHGCPDTDGDGVIDSIDECDHIYGPKGNNGCPYKDTDHDGIIDKDDQCPYTKGISANNGCPVQVKKENPNKVVKEFTKLIHFNASRSSFKEESYGVLLEILSAFQKHPTAQITIEGHTDNIGSEDENQKVATLRANTVRNFLIKNGIPAKNIKAIGYGELKPIASNMHEEGRAMNRRVEIRVSE